MSTLVIDRIAKTYVRANARTEAIRELSFEVDDGEILAVVGPSGCGKTTLLKCVSGLIQPSSGAAFLDGERIDRSPRGLALVFQEYTRSLLPWLSVKRNVTLPLWANRVPRAERALRAEQALTAVGLDGFADQHPWQLSGGMQQRAALARALAYLPRVLLMDEPFASVDAQTRVDLEDLLLDVQARFGITIVLVTHDIDESVYLADRVAVLSARPTSVRELVTIDLPRPRSQLTTKSSDRYAELRAHVTRLIRGG